MAHDALLSIGLAIDDSQITRTLRHLASHTGRTINQSINAHSQPLGRITGEANEFQKSLAASNARVIAFGVSTGVLFAMKSAFLQLVKATIEVEKEMTEVNSIFRLSSQQLKSFSNELFTLASNYGLSFNDATKAAVEFARQGNGVAETLKRTSAALALARISGAGMEESVNSLTSILNTFQKEAVDAMDVVSRMTAVDQNFAISAGAMAEALSRVSSSASDANVSLNETLGLVAAAKQITGRTGSVIGNSFKTMFTRLQRPEVLDDLESVGVKVRDAEGRLRPMMDVLRSLSTSYDGLASSQKSFVAETVGGVYQINILKAIMRDLGSGMSVVDGAMKVAGESTGFVTQRMEVLNETISSQLLRTANNLKLAFYNVGTSLIAGPLNSGLSNFDSLIRNVGKYSDPNTAKEGTTSEKLRANLAQGGLKGVANFAAGPGLQFAMTTLIKLFERLDRFITDSIKDLSGINEKEKQRESINQGLTDWLGRQRSLLAEILSGQTSINTATDLYLNSLKDTLSTTKSIKDVSLAMLPGAMQQLPFLPKSTHAAEGYIPNLEIAEARRGGYQAGRVIDTTINDGSKRLNITANAAESLTRVTSGGQSYDFINPPVGSPAGNAHREASLRKTGIDPYSMSHSSIMAKGFVPNFALSPDMLRTLMGLNISPEDILGQTPFDKSKVSYVHDLPENMVRTFVGRYSHDRPSLLAALGSITRKNPNIPTDGPKMAQWLSGFMLHSGQKSKGLFPDANRATVDALTQIFTGQEAVSPAAAHAKLSKLINLRPDDIQKVLSLHSKHIPFIAGYESAKDLGPARDRPGHESELEIPINPTTKETRKFKFPTPIYGFMGDQQERMARVEAFMSQEAGATIPGERMGAIRGEFFDAMMRGMATKEGVPVGGSGSPLDIHGPVKSILEKTRMKASERALVAAMEIKASSVGADNSGNMAEKIFRTLAGEPGSDTRINASLKGPTSYVPKLSNIKQFDSNVGGIGIIDADKYKQEGSDEKFAAIIYAAIASNKALRIHYGPMTTGKTSASEHIVHKAGGLGGLGGDYITDINQIDTDRFKQFIINKTDRTHLDTGVFGLALSSASQVKTFFSPFAEYKARKEEMVRRLKERNRGQEGRNAEAIAGTYTEDHWKEYENNISHLHKKLGSERVSPFNPDNPMSARGFIPNLALDPSVLNPLLTRYPNRSSSRDVATHIGGVAWHVLKTMQDEGPINVDNARRDLHTFQGFASNPSLTEAQRGYWLSEIKRLKQELISPKRRLIAGYHRGLKSLTDEDDSLHLRLNPAYRKELRTAGIHVAKHLYDNGITGQAYMASHNFVREAYDRLDPPAPVIERPLNTIMGRRYGRIANNSSSFGLYNGVLSIGYLKRKAWLNAETGQLEEEDNPLRLMLSKMLSKEIHTVEGGTVIGAKIPHLLVGLMKKAKEGAFIPGFALSAHFSPASLIDNALVNAENINNARDRIKRLPNAGQDIQLRNKKFRGIEVTGHTNEKDMMLLREAFKYLNVDETSYKEFDLDAKFAKGYIPNAYNPLFDALSRENRATGGNAALSSHPILRTFQNPMGMAAIDARSQSSAGEAIQQHMALGQSLNQVRSARTSRGHIPNLAVGPLSPYEDPFNSSSSGAASFGMLNSLLLSLVGAVKQEASKATVKASDKIITGNSWLSSFASDGAKASAKLRILAQEFDAASQSLVRGNDVFLSSLAGGGTIYGDDPDKLLMMQSAKDAAIAPFLSAGGRYNTEREERTSKYAKIGFRTSAGASIGGGIASQFAGSINPSFGQATDEFTQGVTQAGQILMTFPSKAGWMAASAVAGGALISSIHTYSRGMATAIRNFELQHTKMEHLNSQFDALISSLSQFDSMILDASVSAQAIETVQRQYRETIAELNNSVEGRISADKITAAPDSKSRIGLILEDKQRNVREDNFRQSNLALQKYADNRTFIGSKTFGIKPLGYSNFTEQRQAESLVRGGANSAIANMPNSLKTLVASTSSSQDLMARLASAQESPNEEIKNAAKILVEAMKDLEEKIGPSGIDSYKQAIVNQLTTEAADNTPQREKALNALKYRNAARQSETESAINAARLKQRLFVNAGAANVANQLNINESIGQGRFNEKTIYGSNSTANRQALSGVYRMQYDERTNKEYETATEFGRIEAERSSKIGQAKGDATRVVAEALLQNFDQKINNPELYKQAEKSGGSTPTMDDFGVNFTEALNRGISATFKQDLTQFNGKNGQLNTDKLIDSIISKSGGDSNMRESMNRYLQANAGSEIIGKAALETNKQILSINQSAHAEGQKQTIALQGLYKELDFKKLAGYMGGVKILDRTANRTMQRNLVKGAFLMERGQTSAARATGASLVLETLQNMKVPLDPSKNTRLSRFIDMARRILPENLLQVQKDAGSRIAGNRLLGGSVAGQGLQDLASQASMAGAIAATDEAYPMYNQAVSTGAKTDIANFSNTFNKNLILSANVLYDFAVSVSASKKNMLDAQNFAVRTKEQKSKESLDDATKTNAGPEGKRKDVPSIPTGGEDSKVDKFALKVTGPISGVTTSAVGFGVAKLAEMAIKKMFMKPGVPSLPPGLPPGMAPFAARGAIGTAIGVGGRLAAGAAVGGLAMGGIIAGGVLGTAYTGHEMYKANEATKSAISTTQIADGSSLEQDMKLLQGINEGNAAQKAKRLSQSLSGRSRDLEGRKEADESDFSGLWGGVLGTYSARRFGDSQSSLLNLSNSQRTRLDDATASGNNAELTKTLKDILSELTAKFNEITGTTAAKPVAQTSANSQLNVEIVVNDLDKMPSQLKDSVIEPLRKQIAELQLRMNNFESYPQPASVGV